MGRGCIGLLKAATPTLNGSVPGSPLPASMELQSKGLTHTTMTIGGVRVDDGDTVYPAAAIGFSRLLKHEEPRR